jgi:hypothetical protein
MLILAESCELRFGDHGTRLQSETFGPLAKPLAGHGPILAVIISLGQVLPEILPCRDEILLRSSGEHDACCVDCGEKTEFGDTNPYLR